MYASAPTLCLHGLNSNNFTFLLLLIRTVTYCGSGNRVGLTSDICVFVFLLYEIKILEFVASVRKIF